MINILLVDDHAIVREGLRRLIDDTNNLIVVDEASNGDDAILKIKNHTFDIIILDISMSGKNGIQTLKEIKKHNNSLSVLMLSMHAEEQYAIRAIKAGASGYITKDTASEQLVNAINKIYKGGRYISQEVAELLVKDIYHGEEKKLHEYLSDREFEIFQFIVKGVTSTEIAKNLDISDKTVSTYRTRILKKMNMKSSSDLIYYAIENNIFKK